MTYLRFSMILVATMLLTFSPFLTHVALARNCSVWRGCPYVPTPMPYTSAKEKGLWLWKSPVSASSASFDQSISSADQYGFNAIYVSTDNYISIETLPTGTNKDTQKRSYMDALAHIVSSANSKGIKVDIEAGASNWAQPENQWKGFAIINFLKEYNLLYPNQKVRGLQYDVEPYLLATYDTDKASVLTNYVSFIDQSINQMPIDSTFSIDIPHFFDDVANATPQIYYNGRTTYTYNHLLNILDRKPGSNIIIMAYRNYFSGGNGVDAIASTELREATQTKTNIIIAQETSNTSPSYITFYGMTKADLSSQINTINNAYSNNSNYVGTAVDYIDPFLALR